ncbi:hypothetical protein EDC18_102340 [Natranaerovirga pectinivora]|uniref:Uncharacterized protein n=1 Tax=Natranaerovirga pectinivora TaxID=682400 RepID=A0A4R3MMW5_9FIRM|nr:hypothetical protein [Natranaerovirga pectinivora]TCT16323.1 hypothetical protein EDC18_102340 [Natranaerovirga pectinivora]
MYFILTLVFIVFLFISIGESNSFILFDIPTSLLLILSIIMYIILLGHYNHWLIGLKLLIRNHSRSEITENDLIQIKELYKGFYKFLLLIGATITLVNIIKLHVFFNDPYFVSQLLIAFLPLLYALYIIALIIYPIILKIRFLMIKYNKAG